MWVVGECFGLVVFQVLARAEVAGLGVEVVAVVLQDGGAFLCFYFGEVAFGGVLPRGGDVVFHFCFGDLSEGVYAYGFPYEFVV